MALTKITTDTIDLSSDTTALKMPKGSNDNRGVLITQTIDYLVVAGGGSGGWYYGGGGGAGGYITSSTYAGGGSAGPALNLYTETSYTITVGLGGAGGSSSSVAGHSPNGENSVFASLTAIGGGGGGVELSGAPYYHYQGGNGGSGGGGARDGALNPIGNPGGYGEGTTNQGNNGGTSQGTAWASASGGGGASAVGGNGSTNGSGADGGPGGNGGAGRNNTITGTGVDYAGGGGGSSNGNTPGSGGLGGGGAGSDSGTATSGTANTGGGGGGTRSGTAGSGGTGIIIIRVPNTITATFSSGVTSTLDNTSVASTNIYSVTATTGSCTVTFTDSTLPSVAIGTTRENTTTGKMEIYTGAKGWRALQQTGQDVGLVPSNNFAVALYTGNGGATSVDLGFKPGLTWIKGRDTNGKWNVWYDVQRGPTNMLSSNSENAEATYGSVTPTSTGFAIGAASAGDLNSNGEKYVSWNWKASDSFSYPAVGSQIASAGYTNVAAGFSMVEYTGVLSSSGSYEVQHGLGGVPEIIISKEINRASTRWVVRTQMIDNNPYSYLIFYSPGDAALAQLNSSDGTLNLPTATKFDINWNTSVGTSGYDIIAYCFRSIPGYSLIGKYTGTGSATSSPKIYTGFEPAWLMTKPTSTTGWWYIFDNKRSTSNPRDIILGANSSDAEYTSSNYNVNFYNDGFQYRNSTICCNDAGVEYLFMCFAS